MTNEEHNKLIELLKKKKENYCSVFNYEGECSASLGRPNLYVACPMNNENECLIKLLLMKL